MARGYGYIGILRSAFCLLRLISDAGEWHGASSQDAWPRPRCDAEYLAHFLGLLMVRLFGRGAGSPELGSKCDTPSVTGLLKAPSFDTKGF